MKKLLLISTISLLIPMISFARKRSSVPLEKISECKVFFKESYGLNQGTKYWQDLDESSVEEDPDESSVED